MKQDWFSRLYEVEIKTIKAKIKKTNEEFQNEKSEISGDRKRDYRIYKACLNTAYENDLVNNREAKITSDELSIRVTLSNELELSQEEIKLINYSILPIKKADVIEVITHLKVGVIFYSKKENTLFVADEMVRLLRKLRKKEVANKCLRRTLRVLREPIINQISRKHNIDKSLSHLDKIEEIINEGVSFRSLLMSDIYKKDSNLTEKKRALNELCEKKLNIESLIEYFENIEKDENIQISLDGFEKMLFELNESIPKLNKEIRSQFEIQDEFVLNADLLLDYNIKPRDILDLVGKDDLKNFILNNGIKQRDDDILNTLENYKDAENLYLENYEKVAYRDLKTLKENGISVKESELGIKFEDLTKKIFIELGFNVDEELRKSLNTKKDLIDIILHLDNGDVIIIECKTSKEKGYNKFSSVSRQLKSYKSVTEKNNIRVSKILLIAPEFSDDFITDCEMNMELNLSLITASALSKIFEAFKTSKYTEFPHVLFRDIVINEDRIIKALTK
ncbi:hypothetical protein [Psychroflexus sp. MES1-P1E]|uniref:hypothetical protein n=1 Tax=Psychroflexus sp. MES1-P1E TaxID=2058320 RepID=UPI0026D7090B|nr:hypothetical protein [Psychroflexus sp. MES1-P1E]